MQTYSEFGLRARAIMLRDKITLAFIAEKLGVSSAYVSEILKGTRPGTDQKKKIAEMLGIENQE